MNSKTLSTDEMDDLTLFKALIKNPKVAWPTVMLLIAAFSIFSISTFAYLDGALTLSWTILFNAIASYMCFTVAHEASHSSVCSNRKLNDWAGRVSISLLEPGPFFLMLRYVHMQHHRFTNDEVKDVDVYTGTGPRWLLPLKWLTLDVMYFKYYLKPEVFMKRPKAERREFYLAILFGITVVSVFTLAGWLEYYLLLFFIPTRIAKLFIVATFDFLPHYPHEQHAKDEPFRCTSNRVGMEWLLTPILLYQNYHLVHHLYPRVPFYRNLKVWNARKHYHEAQNPALTDPFSLGPRS